MSCGCCCINTFYFCEQNICGEGVNFDVKAQLPGVHKLVTSFLNIQITIDVEFAVNDFLIFPISDLNEDYQYTVELFDPLGNKIVIRKNEVDYDCFKFQTVISKTLIAVGVES